MRWRTPVLFIASLIPLAYLLAVAAGGSRSGGIHFPFPRGLGGVLLKGESMRTS